MSIQKFGLILASVAAMNLQALAQSSASKVTFQAPAATAKQLFPSLGKAAGVTLLTSPQTENEVLQVDVKDVPLDELLKRIAKVAAAEWKPEGEGFRLVRSSATQNQQEREYLESRAAALRKEQETLASELAKMQALTPALARQYGEQMRKANEEIAGAIRDGRPIPPISDTATYASSSPANRLMMRLLTSFSAQDLARMEMGSRVVYSSNATRMQRPFNAAANRAIGDFQRECQVWLDNQPPAAQEGSGGLVVSGWGALNPMKNGLGKVLLVLSRPSASGQLQAELMASDGEGNIFTRQYRQLTIGPTLGGPRGATTNPTEAVAPDPADKPIELSSQAKDHAAFMNQSPSRGQAEVFVAGLPLPGGGGGVRQTVSVQSSSFIGVPVSAGAPAPRLPVSPEWQKRLVEPDKADPLGFVVSELFAGWAHQKGANLVASYPDSALIPLSTRSMQSVNPAHLEEIAKGSLDLMIERDSNWMTISPKFPAYVRATRVDRDDLARLLLSIQKEGRLSLDALARYASSRTNPAPNPALDVRYVSTLFPAASSDFAQASTNWRVLQLYALLSVDQRRHLGDGGAINLGNLSPSQSAVASSLVFDDLAGPLLLPDPKGPQPQGETRTSAVFRTGGGNTISFGGAGGRLEQERTEFLPTGLPSMGTLTVRVTGQDAVYATRKDGGASPRFFTAEAYGVYTGMAPNIIVTGANAPSVPTYDTFRPASIQTLDFHFQLLPRASMDRQLRDTWLQPGARDVAYEGLSNEFRNKVDEMAKRMKDSRATVNFGGGGGVRPPQP